MIGEAEIIALTVFSSFLASFAQYLFKKNLPRFEASIRGLFSIIKNKFVVIGLLIYIVSLPIYLFALKNGALSFVYPTFATSFIFVLLFSKFGIGEKISLSRVIGIILVIFGISIIALTF